MLTTSDHRPIIEADRISKCFKKPISTSRLSKVFKHVKEDFWALKDVSLSLEKGENLAIVGKNGSGKSTLLKILSNVTLPTSGEATVRGKVASLLELGTGFHPDLTGLENVFFYGAILGFSRSEIKAKLDEIIDFSGVEAFMNIPIRNFSSGMQMRLAFSVAIFMRSDVMLVDEVLAVGDATFQNKCIRKIQEERENGRSLIFVGHNMSAITALCPKSILLENGMVKAYDQSKIIADLYAQRTAVALQAEVHFDEPTAEHVRLTSARILNEQGQVSAQFDIHEKIIVEMEVEITKEHHYDYLAGFHIYSSDGVLLFPANYKFLDASHLSVGKHKVTCELPGHLLNTGMYDITLSASTWSPTRFIYFKKESALNFEVSEVIAERENGYFGEYPGVIRPKAKYLHQRQ